MLFATGVFLHLNGHRLKVDARQAHRVLIGLPENKQCDFDQLLPWTGTRVAKQQVYVRALH